jgi:hypothetical protein
MNERIAVDPRVAHGEPVIRGTRVPVARILGWIAKQNTFTTAKKNLWARARIEFEFKASAFREHGHDPSRCDFIVCWIDDWQDCAIPIIELKARILTLPKG